MKEPVEQSAQQEVIKSDGNNSIKPARFKQTQAEPLRFDEQTGKFSRNIRKPSLIPDNKDKPDFYR